MSIKDEDRAIEAYRKQLAAEADLAAGDLDEIEDHLRSLTDDLRERGMPASVAVAEAARRLGDPRTIAREHARVRSAFGPRLSRARAWSAAALMLPLLGSLAYNVIGSDHVWTQYGVELAFGLTLMIALAFRLPWARSVLLGGLAFYFIPSTLVLAVWPGADPKLYVLQTGVLAFLLPWRRGELTVAGIALALQVWAFGAASYALSFRYSMPDGETGPIATFAQFAFVAATLATIGTIVRARWSVVGGAVSAITLAIAVVEISELTFLFDHPGLMETTILGMLASGVVAALIGSVLSWRSARSTFGSLRGIAR